MMTPFAKLLLASALLLSVEARAQIFVPQMHRSQQQSPEPRPGANTPDKIPDKTPAPPSELLNLDARELPLGGALRQPEIWAAYKGRFVTEAGRVVDTGNGAISHSEGQGYGMLLAVAANDRIAFDRIWSWTRANLMVRDDQLLAWRWEPNARPAIADMNDASDGDILVAWALTEAGEFWRDDSYRAAARRIAVEVGRKLILLGGADGPLLLPAVAGFSKEDRADGPVLNLSYWVYPAFARLPLVAPEVDWYGLSQSGLKLLNAARLGPAALPSDWMSLRNGEVKPAAGFVRAFSYNAIRIPLYMAFAGIGERANYAPFVALWSKDPRLAPVDIESGAAGQPFGETGYDFIAALTLCATQKTPMPSDFHASRLSDNYYPATLQILAVIAAQMRYASCSRN